MKLKERRCALRTEHSFLKEVLSFLKETQVPFEVKNSKIFLDLAFGVKVIIEMNMVLGESSNNGSSLYLMKIVSFNTSNLFWEGNSFSEFLQDFRDLVSVLSKNW